MKGEILMQPMTAGVTFILNAPACSSVVPFSSKELNFARHGSPVQLIKANYSYIYYFFPMKCEISFIILQLKLWTVINKNSPV
jgi:hypothetical protein